jgi:hypothetical protein
MPVAQVNGKFLGKRPARAGAVRFKLRDYVNIKRVKVPQVFGHVVNSDYGMLGNDTVGNCVICDIAHQIMIRARATHRPIPAFTTQDVINVYSDWTGYDPRAPLDANGNNPTDNGTDMQVAASKVRTQGFPDAHGQLHYTKAYGAIQVRSWDELMAATYLFGTVSVGINLQKAQSDQFDNRQPWQFVQGSPFLGGHCITMCGRNSRGLGVGISWGRTTGIERHLLEQTMDEGIIQFSLDYILPSGVSPELIDVAQLDSDLDALT